MTHDEAVLAVEEWERELRPLIERIRQLHRAFLYSSHLMELKQLDKKIRRLNNAIRIKVRDEYNVTGVYFQCVLYAETPQRCEIFKQRIWSPQDVVDAIRLFAIKGMDHE